MLDSGGILDQKRKFLVVGDIMLDRYIRGDIKRISPEAPVPVLSVSEKEDKPGGAGNVALNLAGLNGEVNLMGFVGDDEAALVLEKRLGEAGIVLEPVKWARPTITKTRITAARQQIVRVDEEQKEPPRTEELNELKERILACDFSRYDGVLISDYDKGVCSPELCQAIIEKARDANLVTVVDPKGSDWEKYRNAPLITPNVKELGDALGREIDNSNEAVSTGAGHLIEKFHFDRMVVTRSEKGMTLAEGKRIVHFPTQAREVYDVSGAGDTVAAGLLRFLCDGNSCEESVSWANRAAGIVVGFLGTHSITKELLLEADGVDSVQNWEMARQGGGKIVFTNGCFDILHPGHMDYLKKARQLGDFLVVGLNSDASVKRLKGESRPVNDQNTRQIMLESLAFVDQVILFEEDTPFGLIKSLRPDILVKGGDYAPENIVGREFAGETLTIPFVEGFSTTGLLERIDKLNG
ncbi:MAG: D-glycero-beta-D-manno-heptose 1-phosphate adenylyltransferase [Spirochaetales bacterium]|nr:D-glycero-beta-D-manno-heptose 1-phosphate adenylyltransferase [Spirochaetales bacterium]